MKYLVHGLILGISLFCAPSSKAQNVMEIPPVVCYVSEEDYSHSHRHPRLVPPTRGVQTANFILNFEGDIPPEAEEAFEATVDIWGSLLTSSVPIRVLVRWDNSLENNVLGSAGPTSFRTGFVFDGAPVDLWYPVALAEALTGFNFNGRENDIRININSRVDWYFDSDQQPGSNQHDFITVMLHELAHGLGFASSLDRDRDTLVLGVNDRLLIYESFLTDLDGVNLTEASPNPTRIPISQVVTNDLAFDCRDGDPNDNPDPRLYAPIRFSEGSSVSHLDEDFYPPNDPNSLMTPQLARGEANHNPGPETLCIFARMGWTVEQITTSVPPLVADEAPKIYPNPTKDWINLDMANQSNLWTFTILDLQGRTLLNERGVTRVNIGHLPDGYYQLRLEQPGFPPSFFPLLKN